MGKILAQYNLAGLTPSVPVLSQAAGSGTILAVIAIDYGLISQQTVKRTITEGGGDTRAFEREQ
jgi:hypothetical protein